jgi:hypothetical protein
LFSYAVTDEDNTFTFTDYNGYEAISNKSLQNFDFQYVVTSLSFSFVLYVNGKYVITDIVANDGLWHHTCVSWSSLTGSYFIYIDGSLKVSGSGLSAGQSLPANGVLVST